MYEVTLNIKGDASICSACVFGRGGGLCGYHTIHVLKIVEVLIVSVIWQPH